MRHGNKNSIEFSWHSNRHDNQGTRTEDSDISPCTHEHRILTKKKNSKKCTL